ncbi:formate dehydrogenase accessory sulfurtransferase FdhD [Novosphingobium bradum]|uniref:Sulfur carrier protein FdhD n=1 Tax=Novosphingobium bradum TaxID=1737444 RepID=A0ABV7IRX8_9SPHN
MSEGAVAIAVRRDDYAGAGERTTRAVPREVPIAIELNGVAYAVMMATPCDLDDFLTGFLLSEGLADAGEIGAAAFHAVEGGAGIVARLNLPPHRAAPLMERARRRLGDSSCGICGIESVEAALRPLPPLGARARVDAAAIARGLAALRAAQDLGRETAATHAAAFCRADGTLVALREDVGRHNALDKLVGALARSGEDAATGFIAVTSRCSYELVEKTVRAGCPLLVAISAPTDLAASRARAAGLTLAVLARDDSLLWVE